MSLLSLGARIEMTEQTAALMREVSLLSLGARIEIFAVATKVPFVMSLLSLGARIEMHAIRVEPLPPKVAPFIGSAD